MAKIAIFIAVIFFILEWQSRIYFKELNISKTGPLEITIGNKKLHFEKFNNLKIREVKSVEETNKLAKKKVVILGDSISAGYGILYHDLYFNKTKKILKSENINTSMFNHSSLGISANLDNFYDAIQSNESSLRKNDLVIYQFTYNDILDNVANQISDYEYRLQSEKDNFLTKFAIYTKDIRYKFLNYSNLIRVAQYYTGILIKNTSGSCQERGIDSLGIYTHVYYAKGFEDVSDKYWQIFEKKLLKLSDLIKSKQADFVFLLVPPSLEIPYHDQQNTYNYDLNCATIDPVEKIRKISIENQFNFISTKDAFIRESVNLYNTEGVINHYYLKYDSIHPNEKGHNLIGIELTPIIRKFYMTN